MTNFKEWFLNEEDKKGKIQNLLNNHILFFQKDNDFFGGPEESRIMFARMKNPDEFIEDDNFIAFNLLQSLAGNSFETLFSHKDLPKIKIIDRDKLEKILLKSPCKSHKQDFIQIKEK